MGLSDAPQAKLVAGAVENGSTVHFFCHNGC
jgi:hypothetical protein